MSRIRLVGRRARREERGGVLVFFAVFMPLALILMTFAIDVGNWFEHRRHLQTQADAAALAAAGDVSFPCDASVDTKVQARIEEYGKTLNPQVGSTLPANVQWRLNERHWADQSAASDPVDDTVVEGSPCTAKMIDVKMTEHDLPWLWRVGSVVPNINVKARVNFQAMTRLSSGALPVGVPDVNPAAVRVWFVDESVSPATVIPNSSKVLKLRKNADGTPVIQAGMQIWDNSAENAGTALPLRVGSSRIGMRVAISRDASITECDSSVVECYDATSANGLLFLRGHATAPTVTTGSAPELRDAWLLPGTCGDGYFSQSAVACGVTLSARVDFASNVTANQRRVFAVAGGRDYAMTFNATTGMWATAGNAIPVGVGASVPVNVRVEQRGGTVGTATCANNAPCTRTFTDVQRHTNMSDAKSGPIRQLVVSNLNGTGANSLERCTTVQTACTHDLTVRVGLFAGVQGAASAASEPVELRVAGGGSQNQSLDCDPDVSNLKDEIAQGCEPEYTVNRAEACPASNNELWGMPQPWNCVGIQTGAAVNQVPAGMNLRVLGNENARTCTSPNQWPEVLTDPDLLADDPRLVPVFVTPYASFGGSGSGTVPVRNFAFFYVTGWAGSGGGFQNPCEAMGDDIAGPGGIKGHFLKYVQRLNDGSGGETSCDFNSVTPCVAVLTD